MNWFFVLLWNKSAVYRSAVDPKPVKFVCEITFFPSGDQNNAKCANKQKKKKKKKYKREKLVVLMKGYSRLVTESVSFRQGLTYWHTEFRDGLQDCSVDHMFFKCDVNKLKDGFYGKNPAYFPQIYLWIHYTCNSTSFKLYVSARFSGKNALNLIILPLQCFLRCLFFDHTRKKLWAGNLNGV